MNDSGPFWDEVANGRVLVQNCAVCGHHQLYARTACTACHSPSVEWIRAAGTGQLYSFTVVRRAPSARFADDVPYALGLIELDEGPRLLVRIVGCEPEALRIGMGVEVAGPGDPAERRLPPFRPRVQAAGS